MSYWASASTSSTSRRSRSSSRTPPAASSARRSPPASSAPRKGDARRLGRALRGQGGVRQGVVGLATRAAAAAGGVDLREIEVVDDGYGRPGCGSTARSARRGRATVRPTHVSPQPRRPAASRSSSSTAERPRTNSAPGALRLVELEAPERDRREGRGEGEQARPAGRARRRRRRRRGSRCGSPPSPSRRGRSGAIGSIQSGSDSTGTNPPPSPPSTIAPRLVTALTCWIVDSAAAAASPAIRTSAPNAAAISATATHEPDDAQVEERDAEAEQHDVLRGDQRRRDGELAAPAARGRTAPPRAAAARCASRARGRSRSRRRRSRTTRTRTPCPGTVCAEPGDAG